jgi:hypothetical protein
LATVLDGAPQFVTKLAAAAGLPAAAHYAIRTQVRASDVIPDLEIRALDQSGEALWLLWSEHKKDAPFSTNQLTRYAEAIRVVADGVPARLIAVTLWEPSDAVREEAGGLGVPLLRWRDLVVMADSVGEELGGAAWRTKLGPERDARVPRLLREWLAFCRHELQENLMEPLTPERIDMLAEAQTLLETLEELVETSIRAASAALGTKSPKADNDYWRCPPPPGSWAEDHGCSLYLTFEADEPSPPLFVAGMWNEGEQAEALRADAETLQRFADLGYRFWDDGSGRQPVTDISLTIPMSEVAASPRLEDQQHAVASFCERTFTILSAGGND